MAWGNDWAARAACRSADEPLDMFAEQTARARHTTVCAGCPVQTACLADALDNDVDFGVWGGMTPGERRALLRRRPGVTSWRHILEATPGCTADTGPMQQQRHLLWLQPQEEAAFTEVFRARFVPLVAFLIKAGGSRHDAEDAVQAACVELAKTWHSVDHPGPWLRTTAFRMWLKSVHRIRPDELTDQFPERAADDHSQDVAEKIAVVQLLRRLPLLQRTVTAFEIDGCTPSETAQALGVPAANVRQNLRRARANLQRLLTEGAGGVQ
ncbi:sigma-70 family RNA polymerase sigma factor [Streptomyces sp. PAN_FS17]|uniref:sigma-70 family RNA polymerase sigma factor n=1 Tax=Streptomyces sp. PAN_FS17 TaxID=1855351 RepID=UPI0008992F36|nr:RNA polymerase sigma factor, sigma-70 family [Streptomyces sp. PAN_FS17]